MIIITGGAGFIGSNLLKALNDKNLNDILVVEELDRFEKKFNNLENMRFIDCIDKNKFLNELKSGSPKYKDIERIFHLGACSKTTEPDREYIMDTNLKYSQELLHFCANNNKSLIYASSASVYGASDNFSEIKDNESFLNHYAESKLLFDNYYRDNKHKIHSQVVGLRYFNVFGPMEDHKEGMASVIYHFSNQLKKSKKIRLFKGSHGYEDGEQRRDFVYVKDTIKVKEWFSSNDISGIFNVGTGLSRSFNDVANCVLNYYAEGEVEYINFPEGLESQYQAFTEASIDNLRQVGFTNEFMTLENSIKDYLSWLNDDKK